MIVVLVFSDQNFGAIGPFPNRGKAFLKLVSLGFSPINGGYWEMGGILAYPIMMTVPTRAWSSNATVAH